MKETELAKPVVAWLSDQHWDVYQEVQFSYLGGVADIVAVRHGIVWIIESKTSYTFTVLQQASAWPVHLRSVAVPRPLSHNRDYFIARDYYRVGVLEVETNDVYEAIKPPLFLRTKTGVERYISQLTELHKTFAPAGSRGGYQLTPYKRTMMDVRNMIQKNPGCTIKDLYTELGRMHYASEDSFRGNLLKALEDFEPWCRIDRSTHPLRLYAETK